MIRAWRRLIHQLEPDVALSDFSPSLNVAAHGECPMIAIGNGWTIPPGGRLPTFDGELNDDATQRACEEIIDALAMASEGGWPKEDFCRLLRGGLPFVCTLPQLDPYRLHREHEHYWPVEIPVPTTNDGAIRDTVIVYLPHGHPALTALEAVAHELPWRFHVYAGPHSSGTSERLLFSSVPLDLSRHLPSTCMAIHHGGLGMANWCIIHRVPQLIFPTDQEKLLVGRGVMEAKSGSVLNSSMTATEFMNILRMTDKNSVTHINTTSLRTASDIETLAALVGASRNVNNRTGSSANWVVSRGVV